MCEPAFEAKKQSLLGEAEERFRLFYQMVERIMTVLEDEERERQAEEAMAAATEED